MKKYLINLIRQEPVLVQGAIQATLAMLVGFGLLHWSTEQTGFVLAFTAAVMATLARANTQPAAAPPLAEIEPEVTTP